MNFAQKLLAGSLMTLFGAQAMAAHEVYNFNGRDYEVITSFRVDTSISTSVLPQGAFALWDDNPVYETDYMDYNTVSHDTIAFFKLSGTDVGEALTNTIVIKSKDGAEECIAQKYGSEYTNISKNMGAITAPDFYSWKDLFVSLRADECVAKLAPIYNTNKRATIQ